MATFERFQQRMSGIVVMNTRPLCRFGSVVMVASNQYSGGGPEKMGATPLYSRVCDGPVRSSNSKP